jgi:hypothetical protein
MMELNSNQQTETVEEKENTAKETITETPDVPEKELTDDERLTQLKEFRKNGSVTLDATYDVFKRIRNTFKNDTPWSGPNQAYLLSILMLTLEASLASLDSKSTESQKMSVRNDAIEAMSVFIGSMNGKNSHSAQSQLGMFLVLQNGIQQLQMIDSQISELENKLNNSK